MKNAIHRFVCVLLLLLFVVYNFLLAAAEDEGSLLMQVSIVLVVIISGVYFVKLLFLRFKKPFFFKAWTALLLLNILGFILTADYTDRRVYGMFLGILVTLLTFYPFYYFSRLKILSAKKLIYFFLAMVPIAIYAFYRTRIELLSDRVVDNTNIVNNISYYFVGLMPYVFLIKRQKVLSILIMSVLMFFVVQGSKRGALVIGGVTLLLYFYYLMKTSDKRKKIQGYVMIFFAVAILGTLAYRFISENQYLIQRMTSLLAGESSGRDFLFNRIFSQWFSNQSFGNFLFGFGFGGSLFLTGGHYAHSDWLEIASNFGFFGVLIYLTLILSGVKLCFNKRWDFDKRTLMKTIMAAWLVSSLFSMWYTNINGYTQAILLAYIIGSDEVTLK